MLQPAAQWCHLQPKDALKMPESAWKFLFYSASWSYSAYLLFLTQYTFFQDPNSVFHGTPPLNRLAFVMVIMYIMCVSLISDKVML